MRNTSQEQWTVINNMYYARSRVPVEAVKTGEDTWTIREGSEIFQLNDEEFHEQYEPFVFNEKGIIMSEHKFNIGDELIRTSTRESVGKVQRITLHYDGKPTYQTSGSNTSWISELSLSKEKNECN